MGKKKYKFGETKEYKEGDVVVWGGRKPCIGKIVRRSNEDLHKLKHIPFIWFFWS